MFDVCYYYYIYLFLKRIHLFFKTLSKITVFLIVVHNNDIMKLPKQIII